MANLTGMPISSLPETTLQEGDQVVGYRAETGKAYRTDLADQIADLTEQVNQLNQSLSNKASTKYYNGSVDDMLSDWSTITGGCPELFGVSGECAQFLTNSSTSALWFGIRFRSGSNLEYVIFAGNNSSVYYGRVVNGAISVLRSISGTSISL